MNSRFTVKIKNNAILTLMLIVALFPLLLTSLRFIRTEVVMATVIVYLLPIIWFYNKLLRVNKNTVITSLIFILIVVGYVEIGISKKTIDGVVGYIFWAFIIVIASYKNVLFDAKDKINLYYCIYGVTTYSIISLAVTGRSIIQQRILSGVSVSSAPYSTMIMVFAGINYIDYFYNKRALFKIIDITNILVSFYVISIILQRGINTIMGFIMIVLLIHFRHKRTTVRIVMTIFVVVGIFILYYSGLFGNIVIYISSLLPDRLGSRIINLYSVIATGDMDYAGSSLSDRINLIGVSLSTWTSSINNFMIGVGEQIGYHNSIVGNHSDIIDTFAKYGILGGIIVIILLNQSKRGLFSVFLNRNSIPIQLVKQTTIIYTIVILRGFIGSIFTPEIAVQLYLMLPLAIERIANSIDNDVIGENT